MQTMHCSLILLELVIYNDSLLLIPHLEKGDKSSDKLPTRSQNGEHFTQELLGAC